LSAKKHLLTVPHVLSLHMLLSFSVHITMGGPQQIGAVLVPLLALQIYSICDIPFLHITLLVFFKNILSHVFSSSTTKNTQSSLKLVYKHNDLHFLAYAKGENFQYIKLNYWSLCIQKNCNILSCILLVLIYIYIHIYIYTNIYYIHTYIHTCIHTSIHIHYIRLMHGL
jgi:hypothetical protein